MFFYWVNHFVIAANAIYLSYCFMSFDSWFVMPCLIVSVMCMVPMFFSFIYWPALKVVSDNNLYLCKVFQKKVIASIPFVLLIFVWAWWGGGMAILVGSVVASWFGNILFWVVGQDAMSVVLPKITVRKQTLRPGHFPCMAGAGDAPTFSGTRDTMSDSGCCNKNDENKGMSVPFVFSTTNTTSDAHCHSNFNPASGLPMVNSGFDIQGNTYGTTSSDNNY